MAENSGNIVILSGLLIFFVAMAFLVFQGINLTFQIMRMEDIGSKSNFLGSDNTFSGGVTHSSTTVTILTSINQGQTPTKILSRNTTRQYARITNVGPAGIYLYLTDTASDVKGMAGILLATSTDTLGRNQGTYEIGPSNLWIGAVYGISIPATSTVIYVEK